MFLPLMARNMAIGKPVYAFFFFKSIDVWKIVESGWIKPKETTDELIVAQTSVRLSNNKALRACPWIQQEFERLTSMSSAFTF
jgi:hypothetical protein